MMMTRKETNVKAKSIMTLMLVAARANRAKTPAASFAHLYKKGSVDNSHFFYLNNFLPLNNMWLVMLRMRDSEMCDPCLHFLFLFLLCFLRLMLGVAHGLVNMLVQELKELVDIPAISISRAC